MRYPPELDILAVFFSVQCCTELPSVVHHLNSTVTNAQIIPNLGFSCRSRDQWRNIAAPAKSAAFLCAPAALVNVYFGVITLPMYVPYLNHSPILFNCIVIRPYCTTNIACLTPDTARPQIGLHTGHEIHGAYRRRSPSPFTRPHLLPHRTLAPFTLSIGLMTNPIPAASRD